MNAHIFTASRLAEMGHHAALPYFAVITPTDDLPIFSMWFRSLDSLAEWCRESRPDALNIHTAGSEAGENCTELLQFLRRGTATH